MILRGFGFWGWADSIGHHLHLPRRIQDWLCDRFDLSLDDDPRSLYERDVRYCGKRAMSAGAEVACWRPVDHDGYHQGPRGEHEQFTWNEAFVKTLEPRREG